MSIEKDQRRFSIYDKPITQKDSFVVEENTDGNLVFDLEGVGTEGFQEVCQRIKQLLEIKDDLLMSSGLGDISSWETIFTLRQSEEEDRIVSYWIPKINHSQISGKRVRKFL